MPHLEVRPLGRIERFADKLAYPVMQLLAPKGDSPQLTHFWNNTRMPKAATDHLNTNLMVWCRGDSSAPVRARRIDVRFHLGAWKKYVVLQPNTYRGKWYVGWQTASGAGVSRIPLVNFVRMLRGAEDVKFFGVRYDTGEQIELRLVDVGSLGNRRCTEIPLH